MTTISKLSLMATLALAVACGGSEGTGATSGGGAQGGSTSSVGGGGAGQGGDGGDATFCAAGESRACYEGPAGTEGVGTCVAGAEICSADGSAWGACEDHVLPAPELCNAIGDENCDGLSSCETAWSYGVTDGSFIQMQSIATDAQGNMYATVAWFQGTLNIGGEMFSNSPGKQGLLVKFDSAGAVAWVRSTGVSARVDESQVATDSAGNVIFAAVYGGAAELGGPNGAQPNPGNTIAPWDVYLAKLDPNGTAIWSTHLAQHALQLPITLGPDGQKGVRRVAVDANDDIYIAGTYTGHWGGICAPSCPTPINGDRVWLRKFSSDGTQQWVRELPGSGEEKVYALAAVGSAGVVLGGEFDGNLDVDGEIFSSSALTDGFVAYYDSDGNKVFALVGPSPADTSVRGLAASSSRIVVAGEYIAGTPFGAPSPNSLNVYLAELDLLGNVNWITAVAGTNVSNPTVDVGSDDTIAVAARLSGQLIFRGETHIADLSSPLALKFDPIGNPLWGRSFGQPAGPSRARDVKIMADGGLALIGAYTEGFDAGDQVLPFITDGGFVLRLNP
jgi:hypothetical protein